MNSKTLILIFLLLGVVVLLVILVILNLNKPLTLRTTPQPQQPKSIEQSPTQIATAGAVIDLQSEEIKISSDEIKKLASFLPYKQTYKLSTGLEVLVTIPPLSLQDSSWALEVNINGVDYQVPESDETLMKQSFIEASNKLIEWLRLQGVDTGKIFIVWGDRKIIRDRADQWLGAGK